MKPEVSWYGYEPSRAKGESMRHEDVTFNWSESDPARPALAVLVRLMALTDHAVDDGDLSPYLMRPQLGHRLDVDAVVALDAASSYQFCPIRERDLADGIVRNGPRTDWRGIMALGEPDPAARRRSNPEPSTATPSSHHPLWNYRRIGAAVAIASARCATKPADRYELRRTARRGHPLHRPAAPGSDLAIVLDAKFWLAAGITTILDNHRRRSVPSRPSWSSRSMGPAGTRVSPTPSCSSRSWSRSCCPGWARFGLGQVHGARRAEPRRADGELGGAAAPGPVRPRRHLLDGGWWPGDGRGGVSGARLLAAFQDAGRSRSGSLWRSGPGARAARVGARIPGVLVRRSVRRSYREYEGGHDIACWQGGLADGLVALLGGDR